MKLHLPQDGGVTIIENDFIDLYMPYANGEFVKVYLYILRCAGCGVELSVSSIADVFNHTESDVHRALTYWEKLRLLKLQYDEGGALSDIHLLAARPAADGSGASADGQSAESKAMPGTSAGPALLAAPAAARTTAQPEAPFSEEPQPQEKKPAAPVSSQQRIDLERRRQLMEQEEIRQLMYVADTYYGRPLSPSEQADLLWYYDGLGFSADLIEYLIEYCVSRGHTGHRYMEKVASEWHKSGYKTVTEAKQGSAAYGADYFAVFRALGIRSHVPTPAETEFMDRWLRTYALPLDVIGEACRRTILQIHEPSFEYTDKILRKWHQAGVKTIADIQPLDQAHATRAAGREPVRRSGAGAGRFGNFPQRVYDWGSLEQQLLSEPDPEGKEG